MVYPNLLVSQPSVAEQLILVTLTLTTLMLLVNSSQIWFQILTIPLILVLQVKDGEVLTSLV